MKNLSRTKIQLVMKSLIFISITILWGCSSHTPVDSPQKQYIDEVLELIEEHSINKDIIDINKIREVAYKQLKYTDSIEDCYPIVNNIIKMVGDNHSFFRLKSDQMIFDNTDLTVSIKQHKYFSGQLLSGNIGYINMLGFSSGNMQSVIEYANTLQSLIRSIDNDSINGWILDLRNNDGGNCWPMLAGIGPLLGNGVCGYFIDNKQNKKTWIYNEGVAGVDTHKIVGLSIDYYTLKNEEKPIAVLTSTRNGSSGEVIVVAFREKENVRSFGEQTGGFTTANFPFTLSDGSVLNLTVSVFADRKGKIYKGPVYPDEIVSNVNIEYFNSTIATIYDIKNPGDVKTSKIEDDYVLNAANEWILNFKPPIVD